MQKHKFYMHDFGNGFKTKNAILSEVPYDPEVVFIGSYNHGWSWNKSDFFYGRDMYMWTIMANLFLCGDNILIKRRSFKNDNPDLNTIFKICEKGKIVFADIVAGLKPNVKIVENVKDKTVTLNNGYVWKSYKDGPLDILGCENLIENNVSNIVNYINNTPTIKFVYFTFKSGKWLVDQKNEIIESIREDVICSSIFTPTGNGFGENLASPFNNRAASICHCWIWNNIENPIKVNKVGFGNLNHSWLIKHGVNPNKF